MLAKTFSQRDGSTTLPAASARSEVIGAAFKLTPTELRVLLAIVELGSAPKSPRPSASPTRRSGRMSAACSKRVRRQADLVKLVTGYATPLAG
jgi:hypothetical protein